MADQRQADGETEDDRMWCCTAMIIVDSWVLLLLSLLLHDTLEQ